MRDQEIYQLIGRRLRARRRLLALTQGQVAAACGLRFQQIQKYEAGINAISLARLVTLSQVLRAPLAELLHGLQEAALEAGGDAVTDDGPRRRPAREGAELSV
ncbi:helix-turn-helix transcriptional regulator [Phenylobacterium sp.]|uniref:helix-turn-helix domain-containing protein n=1 Tax=Phenylobacterium sp. TaxID=1871053 RepID=UPI00286B2222|nr:helix-turn-helix transcriptional regulator [Phenylobacterium sp.]